MRNKIEKFIKEFDVEKAFVSMEKICVLMMCVLSALGVIGFLFVNFSLMGLLLTVFFLGGSVQIYKIIKKEQK